MATHRPASHRQVAYAAALAYRLGEPPPLLASAEHAYRVIAEQLARVDKRPEPSAGPEVSPSERRRELAAKSLAEGSGGLRRP